MSPAPPTALRPAVSCGVFSLIVVLFLRFVVRTRLTCTIRRVSGAQRRCPTFLHPKQVVTVAGQCPRCHGITDQVPRAVRDVPTTSLFHTWTCDLVFACLLVRQCSCTVHPPPHFVLIAGQGAGLARTGHSRSDCPLQTCPLGVTSLLCKGHLAHGAAPFVANSGAQAAPSDRMELPVSCHPPPSVPKAHGDVGG